MLTALLHFAAILLLPVVVTIEFHERGAGTELVLTHRGLPPTQVEGHRRRRTEIVGSWRRCSISTVEDDGAR